MISIVIPAYNAEKYLPQCIDSILNQSYIDFEVIAINDGSKDHTSSIIHEYEKKDPRIKGYDQENQGAAKTRNNGIELANGDYLVFVDADDYLAKDYLEVLLDGMNENTDVVLTGYTKHLDDKITIYYPTDSLWNVFKYSATWCKMYRTSFLKEHAIGFTKRLIMEDVEMNIHCLQNGARYHILHYAGYQYNINSTSVTNTASNKEEQLYAAIDMFKDIQSQVKDHQELFINFYLLFFTFILNMCCRNSSKKFLKPCFNSFYDFLNRIDPKWYQVKAPDGEGKKNNLAIFLMKKLYTLHLTGLFISIFLKVYHR